MSVNIKETVVITDANGVRHNFSSHDPVTSFRKVEVTCDGPRCDKGDGGKPVTFTWTEEVKSPPDPTPYPDGMYRMIPVGPFLGGRGQAFCCSPSCLRDLMRGYVPSLSPHEQEELRKKNEATAAKKKAKVKGFPKGD